MLDFTARERYILWMNFCLGAGVKTFYKLLEQHDGDPESVFMAAQRGEIKPFGRLNAESLSRMRRNASEEFINKCLLRLNDLDVCVTTYESDNYPSLLKEIYDPPTALYYRGRLAGNIPLPIAVIGTRHPTEAGLSMTYDISRDLSIVGATVISGLAFGLDCEAAKGALSAEGSEYPTIAVLGSGADVVYPSENEDVYKEIVKRGAVVSEYFPGAAPAKSHFPARNRIISGIARGLLIVEAPLRSGTSITADFALEQGRDLFAMPGRPDDPMCEGTNKLLRDGAAKLVLSSADVLEEYGLNAESLPKRRPKPKKTAAFDTSRLSDEEKRIYEILKSGEKSFDDICEVSQFSPARLNSVLTMLVFSEIIKQSPGRVYGIKE